MNMKSGLVFDFILGTRLDVLLLSQNASSLHTSSHIDLKRCEGCLEYMLNGWVATAQ